MSMSPGSTPHPAPAAPAGAARRALLVLTLVLAALLGVGAGAVGPTGAEARPPLSTSQSPPDPGSETYEVAEGTAAAPGRLRARRTGVRPRDAGQAPGDAPSAAAPGSPPALRPHGDALRCVVMRC
ncbi:hypothetical protein ACIPPS_10260 [Streptomyces sp. NPDC090127]|uniref:hypothetical protein n=1 Tax=Streptomyces sp. NPDC090127 TaxID=3365953 RepID=UPI0038267D9D